MVDNYAAFFNCTPVGRASDSMMAPGFILIQPGSPRFATVATRFYPGSSRFIPGYPGLSNLGEQGCLTGTGEHSFSTANVNIHF